MGIGTLSFWQVGSQFPVWQQGVAVVFREVACTGLRFSFKVLLFMFIHCNVLHLALFCNQFLVGMLPRNEHYLFLVVIACLLLLLR